MVPCLSPGLSALSPPRFPVGNLLLKLLFAQVLVLWVVFRVVQEKILVVKGRVPCACQIYMLLVLQVRKLSPLHLAREIVEDVDIQVVYTQGGLVGEARL